MLTDRDLKEILDFTGPASVLSVYLNTDPGEGNAEAQKLRLRRLVEGVSLRDDQAKIVQYFEHARAWKGRSTAIFSCSARAFFRAYPLAVPVRSQARVGDHPYVKPLADLLDAFGGYGVVLVDKQGARLFLFHLGELIEQEGILGEDVRHTKRGGAASLRGRRGGGSGPNRPEEQITDRNIKAAVEFAGHFFERNRVRRILIGGTEDNIARFLHHLPKTWQSLVVGTFPAGMNASASAVFGRAMEIGQKAEAAREARLVEAMVTGAAKGSGGAVRLEATLQALHDGRVQTLLIQEEYRSRGYQCEGCTHLTSRELESCPYCEKGFKQIEDVVEMAVRRVMQAGGDVEVVRASPELEREGVGALLRY